MKPFALICALALFPAAIVAQPFSFVLDVLNSNFKSCYVQLFEQSVNDLQIKNNSGTTTISFSTSLANLQVSGCHSNSIYISAPVTVATFSTSLLFADADDQATTCSGSISGNSLGLSAITSCNSGGNCGCSWTGCLDSYLTSYSSQSSIVCNVTMTASWNQNTNNQFAITYYTAANPLDYPSNIILAVSEGPASSAVEVKPHKELVRPDSDDAVSYNVDMYVLIDQFANCVPSLFNQNVNNLEAQNETDIVYITFSSALPTIDVSQCNFNQIGISFSSSDLTAVTGLSFNDPSDCSSSVAANAVAVASQPYCQNNWCYCSQGCASVTLNGITTSTNSVCNISLASSWLGGGSATGTSTYTHTYTMYNSPTDYPTSFSVSTN